MQLRDDANSLVHLGLPTPVGLEKMLAKPICQRGRAGKQQQKICAYLEEALTLNN